MFLKAPCLFLKDAFVFLEATCLFLKDAFVSLVAFCLFLNIFFFRDVNIDIDIYVSLRTNSHIYRNFH